MNRDDLERKLIQALQACPGLSQQHGERCTERAMELVDTYMATERSIIEAQIADHVVTRVGIERERIAQAIEASPRLRPEQFAWLHYPTYMRGVKSGMEFAAEIARNGGGSQR